MQDRYAEGYGFRRGYDSREDEMSRLKRMLTSLIHEVYLLDDGNAILNRACKGKDFGRFDLLNAAGLKEETV